MEVTYKILRLSGDLQCQSSCRHIPGKLIVHADQLSRGGQVLGTEWSIRPRFITDLWTLRGLPSVDFFATYLNHKLPMFGSLIPDKGTWAMDVLLIICENFSVYPPTA